MSVYFVRAGTDGPIKIGYADDPDKRIAQLQTGSPDSLYLVLVDDSGGRERERAWHEIFAHARLRGEWFNAERVLRTLAAYWNVEFPDTDLGWKYPAATDTCHTRTPGDAPGCNAIKWPAELVDETDRNITFAYRCESCAKTWVCHFAPDFATSGFEALA